MQAQSEQFHLRLLFAYSIFYTLLEIVNLAREFCRQRIAFGMQASRYVFRGFAYAHEPLGEYVQKEAP